MPYKIIQLSPRRFSVRGIRTGRVHAKKTTLRKAEAQVRLMESYDISQLTDQEVKIILQALWEQSPRLYLRLHRAHKSLGRGMLLSLIHYNPRVYNRLIGSRL